ncbi:hypothetical protein [Leptospira kmetyi]|uniref:hypothetical protein n=1 Tax=Leptospira kmetyi TaxID=408139 RepID=UPI003EBAFD58
MKIKNLKPKENSITPTLTCEFELDYYLKENLPVYFDGNFSYQGKVIGNIVNGTFENHEIALYPKEEQHYHESVYFKCEIELSQKAIYFMHISRERGGDQDIRLHCNVNIRNLKISNGSHIININKQFSEYTIPSSDWIKIFCPILNIGEFSIIEVNHSSVLSLSENKLESSLYQLIKVANDSFLKGDYVEVIFNIRKFLERAKKLSSQILEYSNKNINSSEYGNDLNKLIQTAFQIASKYQHSHSRKDEELNLLVTRQDAQMILLLSMSLAAILSKISQNGV